MFNKKDYNKNWVSENRSKVSETSKVRYYKNKIWFEEFKKGKCCLKCGESHIACLEYHHRNPDDKDKEVSILVQRYSRNRALEEIEKCDLLCSNCHKKLHWELSRDRVEEWAKIIDIRENTIPNSKKYIFTDPEGNEHVAEKGLVNFCKNKNLSVYSMKDVARGKRNSSHGWKVKLLQ